MDIKKFRLACISVFFALISLSGCSCEEPTTGCTTNNDCGGMQTCVSGVCTSIRLDSGVLIQSKDAAPKDVGVLDARISLDASSEDSGIEADAQAPVDSGIVADSSVVADAGLLADAGPDAGVGNFRQGGPYDPNCSFRPPPGVFTPTVEWSWLPSATTPEPQKDQVMSTPLVINLTDDNNDGLINIHDTPDVVFISFDTTGPMNDPYAHQLQSGIVRALSGDTGRELWSANGLQRRVAPASNLAAGDLDGDGIAEIVAERWSGGVIALRADGQVFWECTSSQCTNDVSLWGALSIADLDSNGAEVIRGRCVIEGLTGQVRFCGTEGKGDNGVGGISVVADLDDDNFQEIIAGRTAYSSQGAVVWNFPMRDDGFIAVGQFDADIAPEFTMVGGGKIYRLDSDGSEIWQRAIEGGGFGGPPTIANFDSDPEPEIGVAGRTRYTVYNLDASILFSNPIQEFSSSRTGSSVFDFDADGIAEVVYNDENTLFVYSFDGTMTSSAAVKWSTPNSTLTAHEYPVIADVDGDGKAEIIVGANDFGRSGNVQRGLRVFGDVRDNWVSTRRVWNQHSYHVSNISVSGTAPFPELPGWFHFNTYRTNFQGTYHTPALAVANLVPDQVHATLQCPAAIEVGVWVENRGALVAAPGLPISLYSGSAMSGTLLATAVTTVALNRGEAEFIRFNWTSPPSTPTDIYVVVDDDGMGVGTINECLETDNVISLSNVYCP
jgi:hypothetical protein